MNNLFKKIKRYFKNLFSNRKLEWQSQLDFIIALARANDIPFDPTVFPKPKRHFKNGNIVWEQSQAAEYISDKINEKEMLGEYIFKPWNTAWLAVRKEAVYDKIPYACVPMKDTNKRKAEDGKIWIFFFAKAKGQELWIDSETALSWPICKDCMFKWEHYPLNCRRRGYINLDDIVVITNPNGTKKRVFKCPKCGGTNIYKDGHWVLDEYVSDVI